MRLILTLAFIASTAPAYAVAPGALEPGSFIRKCGFGNCVIELTKSVDDPLAYKVHFRAGTCDVEGTVTRNGAVYNGLLPPETKGATERNIKFVVLAHSVDKITFETEYSICDVAAGGKPAYRDGKSYYERR